MAKFHRDDVEAILHITLSRRQIMGSVMWLHTTSEQHNEVRLSCGNTSSKRCRLGRKFQRAKWKLDLGKAMEA